VIKPGLAAFGCEKPKGVEKAPSLWLRSDQHGREWIVDRERTFCPFPDDERAAQLSKLESFRELQPGWDSYDAEPPSEKAIDNARKILHLLWSGGASSPVRIAPSVEGGVGIIFSGPGKKYADLECFNDGEILAITSEGSLDPLVWSIGKESGSLLMSIEKIRFFLNG
jgi:hypothetical protein